MSLLTLNGKTESHPSSDLAALGHPSSDSMRSFVDPQGEKETDEVTPSLRLPIFAS